MSVHGEEMTFYLTRHERLESAWWLYTEEAIIVELDRQGVIPDGAGAYIHSAG